MNIFYVEMVENEWVPYNSVSQILELPGGFVQI